MDKRSAFFGAGVGIIIVTFVFYLGLNFIKQPQVEVQTVTEALSDDEIVEKARKLGMVMVKELPAQQEQVPITPVAAPALSDEDIIIRARELGFVHVDEVVEIANENQPQQEETAVVEAALTESAPEDFISVVIPFGSSSYGIADILFQSGAIDDASAFNSYVVSVGLSTRLIAGTYMIPHDASFEEITRIISKDRTSY